MGDNGNIKNEYLAKLQVLCEGLSSDGLRLVLWFARFLVKHTEKRGGLTAL